MDTPRLLRRSSLSVVVLACGVHCSDAADEDVAERIESDLTGGRTFQTVAIPAKTQGAFVVEYDAVPRGGSIDAVVGVTSGPATSFGQLAATVRFNDRGFIDARSGDAYAASAMRYQAHRQYHVEMTIRLSEHTYDVAVTPRDGTRTTLGTKLAFRTEQKDVARLDGVAIWAGAGTHRVWNIRTRDVNVAPPAPTSPSSPPPTPPPPAPSTIDATDIIGRASADLPFAQQSGYSTQVIGTYTPAASIPEAGIHGSRLASGDTLRLGKVSDPVDSSQKALSFMLAPSDPSTSGSKRCEISFGKNIEMRKTYWVALSTYVYDWGSLSNGDASLFGTQLHSGDNTRGLSPSFSIVVAPGGRNFRIDALHSTSTSPSQSNTLKTRYPERPIPFGRWVDFVFKFRQDIGSGGLLEVWMDGAPIVAHKGPLGFETGQRDYMKFGYYNWSSGFDSPRKVLLRSPTIVADPTGSKYQPTDLRALLQ